MGEYLSWEMMLWVRSGVTTSEGDNCMWSVVGLDTTRNLLSGLAGGTSWGALGEVSQVHPP